MQAHSHGQRPAATLLLSSREDLSFYDRHAFERYLMRLGGKARTSNIVCCDKGARCDAANWRDQPVHFRMYSALDAKFKTIKWRLYLA